MAFFSENLHGHPQSEGCNTLSNSVTQGVATSGRTILMAGCSLKPRSSAPGDVVRFYDHSADKCAGCSSAFTPQSRPSDFIVQGSVEIRRSADSAGRGKTKKVW